MSTLEAGKYMARRILGRRGTRSPKSLEKLFESENDSDEGDPQPWKKAAIQAVVAITTGDDDDNENRLPKGAEIEPPAGDNVIDNADDGNESHKARMEKASPVRTKSATTSRIPRSKQGSTTKQSQAAAKQQDTNEKQQSQTIDIQIDEASREKEMEGDMLADQSKMTKGSEVNNGMFLTLTRHVEESESGEADGQLTSSSNTYEVVGHVVSSGAESSGIDSDESGQMFLSSRKTRRRIVTAIVDEATASEPMQRHKSAIGKDDISSIQQKNTTVARHTRRKNVTRKVNVTSTSSNGDGESSENAITNRVDYCTTSSDISSPVQLRKHQDDSSAALSSLVHSAVSRKVSAKVSDRKKRTTRKSVVVSIDNAIDSSDADDFIPDKGSQTLEKTKSLRRLRTSQSSGEKNGDIDANNDLQVKTTAISKHRKQVVSRVEKATRKTGQKKAASKQVKAADSIAGSFSRSEGNRSIQRKRTKRASVLPPSLQKTQSKREMDSQSRKRKSSREVMSPKKKEASSQDNDSDIAVETRADSDSSFTDVQQSEVHQTQAGRKTRKQILESSSESDLLESKEVEEEVVPESKKKIQSRKRKMSVGRKITARGEFQTVGKKRTGDRLTASHEVRVGQSGLGVTPMVGKGIRRSNRNRVQPLRYWKLEQAIYKVTEFGLQFDGVSQPVNPTPRLPKAKQRVRAKAQAIKRLPHTTECSVVDESEEEEEEEEDLMSRLKEYGVVGLEVTTASVIASDGNIRDMDVLRHSEGLDMRSPFGDVASTNDDMILARPFNYSSFSSGVVIIRPGGEKESSVVRKSTLVFHIMTGELIVQIHGTVFYAKKGTSFIVPIGNSYSLKNIGQKDVKLYFVHVKHAAPVDVC